MKYRVLAIGKPKLEFAASGVREYSRRLERYAPVAIEYLRNREGSQGLLDRSEGCYRIALDERGGRLSTETLVVALDRLEARGEIKSVAFLIGAAEGHEPIVRERADAVWSLSALTLQHELALVVLLEQLYRAFTIKRGEPYHRG